jgi:hypothetical protein
VPPSAEESHPSASDATPIKISEDAQAFHNQKTSENFSAAQKRPNFLSSFPSPQPTDIRIDREHLWRQNSAPAPVVDYANALEPQEPPQAPTPRQL